MLTIILVVGYFLFCVGMAFFLDYRTKKRKLNETAVEYSTVKNSMGLFMAFSLMCGNLISSATLLATHLQLLSMISPISGPSTAISSAGR